MATPTSFSFFCNVSFLILLLLPLSKSSVTFIIDEFQQNMKEVIFKGNTYASNGVLQLTKGAQTNSVGHASYYKPIHLWNSTAVADWGTDFSFVIKPFQNPLHGDGLSFFLAPLDFSIPLNSAGGYLGLFSSNSSYNRKKILAVEFDTFQNVWDTSSSHVGVNTNSISSVITSNIRGELVGSTLSAVINYNSTTKVLSASLSPIDENGNGKGYNIAALSYTVDLKGILPEFVDVGFSAATGDLIETHTITSWNFYSSM